MRRITNPPKRRDTKTVFDRLPQEFTLDQAWNEMAAQRGTDVPRNRANATLYSWSQQGFIVRIASKTYRKTS